MSNINRRAFLEAAATSTAFTIVPSHVIAGLGHVNPSDKIHVANIGCGTQGIREMPEMFEHPNTIVTAICDVNKFASNYRDWSANGLLRGMQNALGNQNWGTTYKGIPAGLDVAKAFLEAYYAKNKPSGNFNGVTAYEDFRELLEQESDIDVVKIMTPDHTHACIAIAAMQKGIHVVTHKPIANRMKEGRKVIQTARETGVRTHLMAWSRRPEIKIISQWIKGGAIGRLLEIHNWSSRPVWPQWSEAPTEKATIPVGFNWQLWLGPVPDMPYHPNYTHNVFRGWYDFGGGSIADMGHYSLFPLFRALGIEKPPLTAKAYGTTHRKIVDGVCRRVNNNVAFPHSCTIKLEFPDQGEIPSFDFFWYDGGIKPFPPAELIEDGQDIANEGMMFIGEEGKILGGFRGENPRIIPHSKMQKLVGDQPIPDYPDENRTNDWAKAVMEDQESPGSFLHAECLTETINLAAVALRSGERLIYDSNQMEITNVADANKYLTRSYRKGWEM